MLAMVSTAMLPEAFKGLRRRLSNVSGARCRRQSGLNLRLGIRALSGLFCELWILFT